MMKKFYPFAMLLAASIVLHPSEAEAEALTDCFQGPTGNSVIIDYSQGLTGQLNDESVTLVNPFEMAEREFLPMGDSLAVAEDRLLNLKGRFDEALALAETLEEGIDEGNVAYADACLADLEQILNITNVYESIYEHIESRLNSTRGAMGVKEASDVVEDLGIIMTDLDYLLWHIDFCEEYVMDLCEEIEESAASCAEDMGEAEARLDLWGSIIATLSDNCLNIAEYYEENQDNLDEASLIDLQEMINEQVQSLGELATEIKDNIEMPVDKEYALKYIVETANSTISEMNESIEELSALVESYNNIADNFMPFLMGFSENATCGMYVYLTEHEGVLELPSEMSYLETGGTVDAIDGNIFGDPYPDGFPGLNSIVIPSTVETIKNGAFLIEGIKSVSVKGSAVPELQSGCFTESVYANAVLYVDGSLQPLFEAHPEWSRFSHIEALPGTGVDRVDFDGISVKVTGSLLTVEGAGREIVTVFGSDGRVISNSGSEVLLPGKGIYIVKVGNRTVKVAF